MQINIQNVEELIFQDKEIWRKMPEMIHLRDQWRISRMTPMLRAMGKKSLLDFLKNAKREHEEILSDYFGKMVTIDRIDRNLVVNKQFIVGEEPELEDSEIFTGFSTYRKGNEIKVTFWR